MQCHGSYRKLSGEQIYFFLSDLSIIEERTWLGPKCRSITSEWLQRGDVGSLKKLGDRVVIVGHNASPKTPASDIPATCFVRDTELLPGITRFFSRLRLSERERVGHGSTIYSPQIKSSMSIKGSHGLKQEFAIAVHKNRLSLTGHG